MRQFVIDAACAWVRDFHLDGLRLDAVQTIYDFGPRHILADLQAAVQAEAARAGRTVHVIAESNQNDVRLLEPPAVGGHGLDGVWSDDFHHSLHALLTGQKDGFYMDFGRAEHLAKALRDVFVYDGCYSQFHRRRHGSAPPGWTARVLSSACRTTTSWAIRPAGPAWGPWSRCRPSAWPLGC